MQAIANLEDTASIEAAIKELAELCEEVPFGNSEFQNVTAIVNSEVTPERAYRHSALRIMNRLNALNESYFFLRESDLKIRRLDREIAKLEEERPENYDLYIEEREIQKQKILSQYPFTEKLIKDAIHEIDTLRPVVEKVGKLSREKFEKAEAEHFRLKSEGAYSQNLFEEIVSGKLLN